MAWSGIMSDEAKKWSDMITHNISFTFMEGKTITVLCLDFGQWPTVASIRLDTLCVCESYLAEHCLAIGTQPHSADYTMYILL